MGNPLIFASRPYNSVGQHNSIPEPELKIVTARSAYIHLLSQDLKLVWLSQVSSVS
jgi:hypothetical protein